MKKNLFTLAVLFMMLAAPMVAQPQAWQAPKSLTMRKAAAASSEAPYRLDSVCTVQPDGSPVKKQVVEYGANGRAALLYELGYSWPAGSAAPVAVPTGKHEYSYTDGGVMQKEEVYQYVGGEYRLSERTEVVEFYKGTDLPGVTIDSRPSDGVLQPFLKQVTTAVKRDRIDSYEAYLWQGGEWVLYADGHMDYNGDGTTRQETINMLMDGFTMTEAIAYEYDSHQTVQQVTITVSVQGQVLQQGGIAYENRYDERDLLVEQKIIPDGEAPTIDYYYWQGGTTTLVTALPRAFASDGGFVDLNGRRHSAAPSRRGLYIVGGRKVAY
ncbi:MAG: hypothetical protein IJ243_07790 [Prevotella sp.]|nr:hypothetical protein [Prevotella sp.]